MITNQELQKEKEYLKKDLLILDDELEKVNQKVKSLSSNIQEQMSYAWDKTNRLSDTEFVYALANIQKRSVFAENANKRVRAYKKMKSSAYFARIDFDDGEEILPIYIGIASLSSGDDFYVFDWRAPIASMFYNNEVGEASYTISTGEKITGKITLKRQYRIKGDEIVEIFDTDMQIIDNVLKNMLSANASSKMKNIVNTIQKEQNEVIRKNDVDLLVVQGPAGCGKTSIAMHKIAYLLYSQRDKINNSNVMILSPNEIFNNYISEVLPGIGEDNVCEATFLEFAKAYIHEFEISSKIEDAYEVVYASQDSRDKLKYNELKFKFDRMYAKVLDEFIDKNKVKILGIEPVEIDDDVIVSADEVEQIARKTYISGASLYIMGKKIIERIFMLAAERSKRMVTLDKLKTEALENLAKVKTKIGGVYRELFENKEEFFKLVSEVFKKHNCEARLEKFNLEAIFDLTNKALEEDRLEFQDVTPFMYLKSRIIGIGANKNIKYVLIDEAQDYSVMQYKILSMLFKNANIILLGDINQSILPFNNISSYETIKKAIIANKLNAIVDEVELKKTYRSTFEINEYAKKVLSLKNDYTQIERHGDEVCEIRQDKFNVKEIIEDALNLKKSYNTVAIICKNEEETLLYNQIINLPEYKNKFLIVTKNDKVFVSDKIMIIPSYISKGLEFDAVIVGNASSSVYAEKERNLFYVVLTRALHKLKIYYERDLTKLLEGEKSAQEK